MGENHGLRRIQVLSGHLNDLLDSEVNKVLYLHHCQIGLFVETIHQFLILLLNRLETGEHLGENPLWNLPNSHQVIQSVITDQGVKVESIPNIVLGVSQESIAPVGELPVQSSYFVTLLEDHRGDFVGETALDFVELVVDVVVEKL